MVLVVGSAVLVEVASGIHETTGLQSRANVAHWSRDYSFFACLSHQVESVVPPGRVVWASYQTPKGAPGWIRPFHRPEEGRRSVCTVDPSAEGSHQTLSHQIQSRKGCFGFRVKAVWPSGAVRFGVGSTERVR